jgi:hypothetical protein
MLLIFTAIDVGKRFPKARDGAERIDTPRYLTADGSDGIIRIDRHRYLGVRDE